MTATAASLRGHFPEFTDPVRYPDGWITFWLGIAYNLLNTCRWNALLDHGAELFTCHHLALSARAAADAAIAAGMQAPQLAKVPGMAEGMVASKTVDKVTIAYDTEAIALEKGGFWNLTMYGIQFLTLARMHGAGGIQV
jgi:hypothetical protein